MCLRCQIVVMASVTGRKFDRQSLWRQVPTRHEEALLIFSCGVDLQMKLAEVNSLFFVVIHFSSKPAVNMFVVALWLSRQIATVTDMSHCMCREGHPRPVPPCCPGKSPSLLYSHSARVHV